MLFDAQYWNKYTAVLFLGFVVINFMNARFVIFFLIAFKYVSHWHVTDVLI